jgi:hypothetical protein
MRTVLSAVTFALIICVGYLVVTRLPWVGVYRDCYNTAYSIINEAGMITRRAWTNDETICNEHKVVLLKALSCFDAAQNAQPMQSLEKDLVLQAAQTLAKGTKNMNEMIADHNKVCTYRKATLDFDPRTDTWY